MTWTEFILKLIHLFFVEILGVIAWPKHIDRATYEGMDAYTNSQAHLRAFLKTVA